MHTVFCGSQRHWIATWHRAVLRNDRFHCDVVRRARIEVCDIVRRRFDAARRSSCVVRYVERVRNVVGKSIGGGPFNANPRPSLSRFCNVDWSWDTCRETVTRYSRAPVNQVPPPPPSLSLPRLTVRIGEIGEYCRFGWKRIQLS